MARVVFPVAALGVSIPGAPTIAAQPLFNYRPNPIAESIGDWLFGPTSASLVPFFGASTLTAQSNTQQWASNNVTLKAAGEALVSNIPEAMEQSYWIAFRWHNGSSNNGKNSFIVGNVANPLSEGGTVISIGIDGRLNFATYGGSQNVSYPVFPGSNIPPGYVDGQWIIAVVSMTATTFTRRVTGAATTATPLTATRKMNSRAMAVGNAYFTGNVGYTPVDANIAAFGYINGTISSARIDQIYDEVRSRLSARGINVNA